LKHFLLLAAMAVLSSRLCSAAPCASGSLSSYVALGTGGCTLGGNTLFNFQILSGTAGATPIAPGDVTIAPLGGTFDPGIDVSLTQTAASGTLLESLFTYQIAGNSFVGSSLTLANSSETADGAVTDIQNFCAGGAFGPDGVTGCSGFAGSLLTLDGLQNHDSASFSPTGLLSITDDFTLDGGLQGSASGGSFTDRFTATPEPGTFLITGLALAMAAGLKLRFRR